MRSAPRARAAWARTRQSPSASSASSTGTVSGSAWRRRARATCSRTSARGWVASVAHSRQRVGAGEGAGRVDPGVERGGRRIGQQARAAAPRRPPRMARERRELVGLHGVLPLRQAVELDVHELPAQARGGVDGHEPHGRAAVVEQRRTSGASSSPPTIESRRAASKRRHQSRDWPWRSIVAHPRLVAQQRRQDLLALEGQIGRGQARQAAERHVGRLARSRAHDRRHVGAVHQPAVQAVRARGRRRRPRGPGR